MARPSPAERLNDAVEAIMADRGAPASVDTSFSALLRIATDLRDLPHENFRARLKADLQKRRAGGVSATPYLIVKDAASALAFYKNAFGAAELMEPMIGPGGKIMHAEVAVGDARIMIADESPEWGNLSPQSLGGSPVIIALQVPDVDSVAKQAIAAGAKELIPVADQFYGDRAGRLADPFGHVWIVSTHVEDVSAEELQRRVAAFGAPREGGSSGVNPIREGFRAVTPYLQVEGAAKFIEFMQRAFGAEEVLRVMRPEGIAHAEVKIGDSILELADASAEFPAMPTAIHLYVDDSDAVYERALGAGATSTQEPTNQDYGDREAGVRDRFGNRWYIATHLAKKPGERGPAHIPEGLHAATPYLHPRGAPKLIDFLKHAFDAEEAFCARAPDGTVVHAKIRIADSIVEMGEAHGPYQPMPTALHLYVPDTDAVYARALRSGGTSLFAPADRDYGDRIAGVKDPCGNWWYIATHKKDVAPEEMQVGEDVHTRRRTEVPAAVPKDTVTNIIPTMRYHDAPAAIEWLCKAFGFEKHLVVPGEKGTIAHAQLVFGRSMIMLGSAGDDEYDRLVKPPRDVGGVGTQSPYIIVADADEHYARAVAAGAEIVIDIKDEDYGGRGYTCRDPEGHVWNFGTYDPWARD